MPSQKFEFFIFERIRRLEELFQFFDSAFWQLSDVFEIRLERRAVWNNENSIVPFFLTLIQLQDFENADGPTAQHKARIRSRVVNDEDIRRITISGLGRGNETPIVWIWPTRSGFERVNTRRDGSNSNLARLPLGVSTTARTCQPRWAISQSLSWVLNAVRIILDRKEGPRVPPGLPRKS